MCRSGTVVERDFIAPCGVSASTAEHCLCVKTKIRAHVAEMLSLEAGVCESNLGEGMVTCVFLLIFTILESILDGLQV